jgi:rhamnose transport system ATP-binding protein
MLLVRAQGLSKSYGGVRALTGVDFDLHAGEVHALVGENGAGKSTLVKIITGAVAPDSGTLEIRSETVAHHTPANAKRLGIAAIYQHPALFAELSVEENIALAMEQRPAFAKVDWAARRATARKLLERVGAEIEPQTEAGKLSAPQRQLVEIARALGAEARVLILDEPTASLTARETDRLFALIRELRARGAGLIYISHRLEELPQIADLVTALRDGCVAGSAPMTEVDRDALIRMMVGRDVSQIFPKRTAPIGDVLLEAGGLNVRAGEIVGLAGLIGSGRTEFAQSLSHTPDGAPRPGIGHVPEDRPHLGVIPEMPVAQNITLADIPSRNGLVDFHRERAIAQEFIARLGIKTSSPDAEVSTLSGGNQQKVAIARWLNTNPRVLILDEPTQGIDVGAKAEVHRQMVDLAASGVAILMISSDLPEILGMSDRIAVMAKGKIAGVLDRNEATEQKVLSMALGGGAA